MNAERNRNTPKLIAFHGDPQIKELPHGKAQLWPEQFLDAITPGADLSLVGSQFLHWLLVDPVDGMSRFAKRPESKKAIETVGVLYARRVAGDEPSNSEWRAAYAYAARVRQSEKLIELLKSAPQA